MRPLTCYDNTVESKEGMGLAIPTLLQSPGDPFLTSCNSTRDQKIIVDITNYDIYLSRYYIVGVILSRMVSL